MTKNEQLLKAASSAINRVKVRRLYMAKNLADWRQLSKDEKAHWPTLGVHLNESDCLEVEQRFVKDLEDFDSWIAAKIKTLTKEASKL